MGIRRRLHLSFGGIIVGGLILLTVLLSILTKSYLYDLLTDNLRKEAHAIEQMLEYLPENEFALALDSLATTLSRQLKIRVTFMSETGDVLADSDVDYAALDTVENHINRPEVGEAREIGWGTGRRTSATVQEPFLYVAIHQIEPATPVSYVRLAMPLSEVNSTVLHLRMLLIIGGVIILIIVSGTTFYMSSRITNPLNKMARTAQAIADGDYSARTRVSGEDEMGKLGDALNRMAETIESDIRQMRKLERMRTEFIGNTSHELKTPIASIKGYIETLLSGGLDDREVNVRFLERTLQNADRLQLLVQDLIQISRIESGEMRMSLRYFNILELARDLEQEYAPQFRDKAVDWRLRIPEQGDLKVRGDMARIKQVLTNLITNAMKYTHEGEVVLEIEDWENKVKIAVRDTGPGIPPEYQSRVFERFYRIDKDRSRNIGGTGLGLAIVKHIVSAHGSEIQLDSDGQSGSTFWFLLEK
ncbi:MAG: HAMP domain-containing protein [Candidatus Marinimicrobia bacterium]|nr:HAMP domain-containing protein [Candidatus Neomarinimicrobiota bacterium]MCF7828148.1 HAMP domain-containing protein [Candidatus Neomarinimicrobiota bacterium]MCF7879677.1 HAMP domain-containing protein [Candidatus Neomarinimicrobiota bacterium]